MTPGPTAHEERRSLRGSGALCEVLSPISAHTGHAVKEQRMQRMVLAPSLPQPRRALPCVRPGCNPRLHRCKRRILLLRACCSCRRPWDCGEIKSNSLPSEREGEANFELEIGCHAQLWLADVLTRRHTRAKSHSPGGHAAVTPTLHLLTKKANIVLKSSQDAQTRLDFRQEIIFSNFG